MKLILNCNKSGHHCIEIIHFDLINKTNLLETKEVQTGIFFVYCLTNQKLNIFFVAGKGRINLYDTRLYQSRMA